MEQSSNPEVSAPQSNRNLMDSKRALSIFNSRTPVSRRFVGQQILLTVQGNPFLYTAEQQEEDTPGRAGYFDKYIVNVSASSAEAASRKEVKAILKSAVMAESEGNVEEADKLFRQWLNATQMTFSVGADRGHRFASGDQVTAVLIEVETKAGHQALALENPRYKAPTRIERIKHDLTDLLGEDDLVEAPAAADPAPAEPATITA